MPEIAFVFGFTHKRKKIIGESIILFPILLFKARLTLVYVYNRIYLSLPDRAVFCFKNIMKKKFKKKKKIFKNFLLRQSFFTKAVFVSILIGIISILYVFQVAQAKSTSSIQQNKTVTGKINTLDEHEPIQIAPGFTMPFSLEKPVQVIIPSITIDLSVVDAEIIDGHWEVSENFANHGMGSAYPGQIGNMVIFAHARPNLFLDLQNISENDLIYILTDKKWYSYTVTEITQVTPDQVEVIAPTDDERITLFTCSGFADEKRLIVVGKRKVDETNTIFRKIY